MLGLDYCCPSRSLETLDSATFESTIFLQLRIHQLADNGLQMNQKGSYRMKENPRPQASMSRALEGLEKPVSYMKFATVRTKRLIG